MTDAEPAAETEEKPSKRPRKISNSPPKNPALIPLWEAMNQRAGLLTVLALGAKNGVPLLPITKPNREIRPW